MKKSAGYFATAESWAIDVQETSRRTQRTAWLVAGCMAGIAIFEAVALALMMPLKTVEPITVLVDRQTGFVQALDLNTPRRLQADAALTSSLLAQYVMMREGFDRAIAAHNYKTLVLQSSGLARSQYISAMSATNPNSRLLRIPSGGVVAASVKSISPLAAGLSLVRFETRYVDRRGSISEVQPWVAIIRYRFNDGPMSFDKRLINPLGFQVTSYRRTPETVEKPIASSVEGRLSGDSEPNGRLGSAQTMQADAATMARSNLPLGSPLDRRVIH